MRQIACIHANKIFLFFVYLFVYKDLSNTNVFFVYLLIYKQTRANASEICGFFCDADEQCLICDDKTRQNDLICVVKEAKDVFSFEKAGYKGLYHVLGGLLSPLDNIGPSDIKIEDLSNRVNNNISEVIIALDGSIEGDATALYISDILSKYDLIISKLARGIPMGSQLDYIDDITLMRSLQERRGM